jgi:ParB-like chromosome segregation protein Spo0J
LPFLVPIKSLTADPRNARLHSKRNLDAIRLSLREFGMRKPIVVKDGVVVAGNGTLQAADMEGWEVIACVDASDLTSEQAQAYALADNQTGDLAAWAGEPLKEALARVPETLQAATGFGADEVKAIQALAFTRSDESPKKDAEFVTLKLTKEQAVIVRGAVAKVRECEQDSEMAVGRALELICAEYLSGAP